jgi:hypothetical protein
MTSIFDIFNRPFLPSPMGCAKKPADPPVSSELIQLSYADAEATLTSVDSEAHICKLLTTNDNTTLGRSEKQRVATLANKIAEFVVWTKFAPDHVLLPNDSKEVGDLIAQLSNDQKSALTDALASKILANIYSKKISGPTEQQAMKWTEFFFVNPGQQEAYLGNWCARPSENPLTKYHGKAFPAPLTFGVTNSDIKAMIVGVKKLPTKACLNSDNNEEVVKFLNGLDDARRLAILSQVQPSYPICSVFPGALYPSDQEQPLQVNGTPLNIVIDEQGNLPKDLVVDFGDKIGKVPATLAEDKKALAVKVKIPADLPAGKQTVKVFLGDKEIGTLENGFEIKAKRQTRTKTIAPVTGHKKSTGTGFCDTHPTDPKCNF